MVKSKTTALRSKWIVSTMLLLATAITGIMAGFFWAYSFNINLALSELNATSYVKVQALLNIHVRHPVFFSIFFGSGIVTLITTGLFVRRWQKPQFWLLLIASIVYIGGVILFTHQVHLPLNYAIESWEITEIPANWDYIRDLWIRANIVRTTAACTCFILCIITILIDDGKNNMTNTF